MNEKQKTVWLAILNYVVIFTQIWVGVLAGSFVLSSVFIDSNAGAYMQSQPGYLFGSVFVALLIAGVLAVLDLFAHGAFGIVRAIVAKYRPLPAQDAPAHDGA